jgi:hypothetical protein
MIKASIIVHNNYKNNCYEFRKRQNHKYMENINNDKTKFTLLGVVVHLGDKSGHYIYESIVANKELNDSNAEKSAFTNYSKEEVEKNWTILLYKKEDSILESTTAAAAASTDKDAKTGSVSGGSRKKRKQKSKKSRRSKNK